jgi:hypothetical protein
MIGKAQKETERIPFTIKFDEELDYDSREEFAGEETKGILKTDGTTVVEMVFHIEHIFGDKSVAMEELVNSQSVGFDYFKQFVRRGKLDVTQAQLKSLDKEPGGYLTLMKALRNLVYWGKKHREASSQLFN